jgi:hypothetical protein
VRDRGARIAAAGLLAALASACSIDPRWVDGAEAARASRGARERQMTLAWQDHSLRELIAAWGPPRQYLDLPGGGNPPGFVLVYPRDGASGCLDTFAVAYGEEVRVRSYHCR